MVGKVANAPPTAVPVDCSCMAAICGLGHHRAARPEPPPINLRDAMTARSTLRSKNRIQFDPIHVKQLELAVITSREACWIHSGQNGRIAVKHHHRPETQEHIALAVMTKEAEQIAALIAGLRKSACDIDKQRHQADAALRGALDVRRTNLMATISALEDRLSAIQGLIRLDRPYVAHRMH
jgi:hypothetical protein